jgi:hypothetical protein
MGLSIPIIMNTVQLELIGIGTVALLVSRTVSVLFTSLIVNSFRKDKIPASYQYIMSFSGLRGAVAFYLALNVHSEYENLIITTTIGLIIVTIIGLGGTTTCLLKAMAKYFPEDGIFHNEDAEEMLMRREGRYSGLSESIYDKNLQEQYKQNMSDGESVGVITRLEKIDRDYGQKYLRKNGWEDFLEEDNNPGNYQFYEFKQSPERGHYHDNLSNYQMSIAKYLEDSAVNLPYQDRKSVRLSMMSEKKSTRGDPHGNPFRASYLHPQRNRGNSKIDVFELRGNMSRRMDPNQSYFKSTRKEQMSIMSEPRTGMPRGIRGIEPMSDKRVGHRLSPGMDIKIGNLEDISSKGSNMESKLTKQASKPELEEKKGEIGESKLQSFNDSPSKYNKNEERKVESFDSKRSSSPERVKQVKFKEPETADIKIEPLESRPSFEKKPKEDKKEDKNKPNGKDEDKKEDK